MNLHHSPDPREPSIIHSIIQLITSPFLYCFGLFSLKDMQEANHLLWVLALCLKQKIKLKIKNSYYLLLKKTCFAGDRWCPRWRPRWRCPYYACTWQRREAQPNIFSSPSTQSWTRSSKRGKAVVPSHTAVSHNRGPRSCKKICGKNSSNNVFFLLWGKTQCGFYCFGVKRSAIFTGRGGTAWAVANFMLYPAASQVVALPPRRPFLATGQHLGLMCPTLLGGFTPSYIMHIRAFGT